MLLNSLTECCVGFVFNSPEAFKYGTNVRCINKLFFFPYHLKIV